VGRGIACFSTTFSLYAHTASRVRCAAVVFILCLAAKNEPRKQISASRNRKFACSRARTSRKRGRKHCAPKGLMPFGFPQRANVAALSLRSCLREGLHLQLLRLQVKETCKHERRTQAKRQKLLLSATHPRSTNFQTKTISLPSPAARGCKAEEMRKTKNSTTSLTDARTADAPRCAA